MVQVAGDAAEQERLTPDAGILESRAELLVLGAPARNGFVEAIHAHQVVAPEALVAALDGDEAVGERRVIEAIAGECSR